MSWIEQAAAKAVELAEDLSQRNSSGSEAELIERRIRVASHLTYMAGLLNGLEMVTMEEYHQRFAGASSTQQGIAANERAARLRAEQKLDEVQWHRDRYLRQRDELLAAVREYLASPGEHPRRLLQRRYDDIVAPLP